jgi:serine/threonine-protein kinase
VFRQPRDRLIFDVITEWFDDLKAWTDPATRPEVRARWRARSLRPGLMTPSPLPGPSAGGSKTARGSMTEAEMQAIGPARADAARRAMQEHDELMQLVASLPPRDRKQLKEIGVTAKALVERVRSLSLALAELDRSAPVATEAVDREIAELEAQANPLDREASEARVRRLAMLKRDRRGLGERARRRDELEAKLESCSLALQNLRFDVLRLKTGGSSPSNVTLIAERAMSLAHDVDALISANAASGRKR